MTARLRIILAASACLLAAMPALAQDVAQQQPPAPAKGAIVGPPQLSNFSLNGTVTRAAPDRIPAPARTQPSARKPAQATAKPPAQRTAAPRQTSEISAPEPARIRPEPRPEAAAPDSESVAASPAPEAPVAVPRTLQPVPAATPAPANRLPILPWILAALATAGAAAWFFFFRNRNRESYAGISDFDLSPEPPRPPPAPPVAPRVAAEPKAPSAPPAAAPGGVISTRLRPWLEIEFRPDRAVVDDNRAAVAFELTVVNSGTVVARDVLLEASLFNAGPVQDQQIQLFFDNPVGKGDRIPAIPPSKRITVETAVFMARDQVRPIEIEGRPLFVPMIAFNALYRWGESEGQTSVSYLVGKGAKGEKLAPFRLDLGPRIFRGLDAREHALKVRI